MEMKVAEDCSPKYKHKNSQPVIFTVDYREVVSSKNTAALLIFESSTTFSLCIEVSAAKLWVLKYMDICKNVPLRVKRVFKYY